MNDEEDFMNSLSQHYDAAGEDWRATYKSIGINANEGLEAIVEGLKPIEVVYVSEEVVIPKKGMSAWRFV